MPRARTILAFDFGTRRVGIAIGNTITASARPLETLDEAEPARRFERIGRLVGEWRPDALVPKSNARMVRARGMSFAQACPAAGESSAGSIPSIWYAWMNRSSAGVSNSSPGSALTVSQAFWVISASSWPGPQPA